MNESYQFNIPNLRLWELHIINEHFKNILQNKKMVKRVTQETKHAKIVHLFNVS